MPFTLLHHPAKSQFQKVFLNGKPYKKTYITYDDIINGSTLKFVMGKKPNKAFGKAAVDRPIVLNK